MAVDAIEHSRTPPARYSGTECLPRAARVDACTDRRATRPLAHPPPTRNRDSSTRCARMRGLAHTPARAGWCSGRNAFSDPSRRAGMVVGRTKKTFVASSPGGKARQDRDRRRRSGPRGRRAAANRIIANVSDLALLRWALRPTCREPGHALATGGAQAALTSQQPGDDGVARPAAANPASSRPRRAVLGEQGRPDGGVRATDTRTIDRSASSA